MGEIADDRRGGRGGLGPIERYRFVLKRLIERGGLPYKTIMLEVLPGRRTISSSGMTPFLGVDSQIFASALLTAFHSQVILFLVRSRKGAI